MTTLRHCLLPVLLLLLGGCNVVIPKAQRSVSATAEHMADGPLDVQTRNGRVEIISDPNATEVVIEATLTCGGGTQADADQRVAEASLSVTRGTDRTLFIEPRFPGGTHPNDGAAIKVTLPGARGVLVRSGNGALVVHGLGGELDAETSNGAIEVRDHDGPAHVKTSNGRIELHDHGGPVVARTSNGRITVSLRDDQPGPVELRSSNGKITLSVGPAFAGAVEMETSNGSLNIEDTPRRVTSRDLSRSSGTITIGESGEASTIDTSNGSITITVR